MSSTIHIDAVEQVDLSPIRPGRGWYGVGSLVIGAGLVIGFFLLASGAFGYLRDLGDLAPVALSGRTEVDLSAGIVTVYHEPEGGPVVVPGGGDLLILDPRDSPVPLRAPSRPDQYLVEGRRGHAVAEFDAPTAGRYQVEADIGATGGLTVGRSPTDRLTSFGLAGLVIAGAALVVGLGVLVVTRRRRGVAIAVRIARQQTSPAVERLQ